MKKPFYAKFARPIIALVVVMLPFTVWAAILALKSNRNDVKEWLPDTFQATQDYRAFQQHFGDETFVLVSWEGCTLEDPRPARWLRPWSSRPRPRGRSITPRPSPETNCSSG